MIGKPFFKAFWGYIICAIICRIGRGNVNIMQHMAVNAFLATLFAVQENAISQEPGKQTRQNYFPNGVIDHVICLEC